MQKHTQHALTGVASVRLQSLSPLHTLMQERNMSVFLRNEKPRMSFEMKKMHHKPASLTAPSFREMFHSSLVPGYSSVILRDIFSCLC